MKFIPISLKNLYLATEIELKCFDNVPQDCAYANYLLNINGYETGTYFLVYDKKEIIGVSAYYEEKDEAYEKDTAWVGWYGVLPEKRNQGYGRKILMETFEIMEKLGYKFCRLYTSSSDNNFIAKHLYDTIFDFKQPYNKEKNFNFIIYSKAFTDVPCPKIKNNINYHYSDLQTKLNNGYKEFLKARESCKKPIFEFKDDKK